MRYRIDLIRTSFKGANYYYNFIIIEFKKIFPPKMQSFASEKNNLNNISYLYTNKRLILLSKQQFFFKNAV